MGVELESMTSRSIRRASKKRDLGLGTMNKVSVETRERERQTSSEYYVSSDPYLGDLTKQVEGLVQ